MKFTHPENFECIRCHAEMQITNDLEGLECSEECNKPSLPKLSESLKGD